MANRLCAETWKNWSADGKLVTCLFAQQGYDLKTLMRNGATDTEILDVISVIWLKRTDCYSEERLAALHSPTGYDPKSHQKIEMISLGG